MRVALKRQIFSKGGQIFGRDVKTVAGTEGFRVRLTDGSIHNPRELLVISGVDLAPAVERPVPEETRKAKKKQERILKDIGGPAPDLGPRVTKPKAAPLPAAPKREVKRAPRTESGDYLIESIVGHKGTGDAFRLKVKWQGLKTPSLEPIESFITDGYVNSVVYTYLRENRLVKASGI